MMEKQDQIRIAENKMSVEAVIFANLTNSLSGYLSSSNSSSSKRKQSKTADASRLSFRPYDYDQT